MNVVGTLQKIDRLLAEHHHGWCSVEKAHLLAATVFAFRPAMTVEIGVWGGRSLLPMALAVADAQCGKVIGIDPWSPTESVKGQDETNAAWWGHVDHDDVYRYFMDYVRQLKLDNVEVVRQPSDCVEPPTRIDLLHIDGNHGEQSVRDVDRFASRVPVGGLCFFDDLFWQGVPNRAPVDRLHAMGFVSLYLCDTGSMFQKVA